MFKEIQFKLSCEQMESTTRTRTPCSPSDIATHLLRPAGTTAVAVALHAHSLVRTWLRV